MQLSKMVTGGYCFSPEDITSALSVCELETLLTLDCRLNGNSLVPRRKWHKHDLATPKPFAVDKNPPGKQHPMLKTRGQTLADVTKSDMAARPRSVCAVYFRF